MENIKVETTGKKHTKTLDTLVEDINNVLTGISSGIKPEVKEEQVDKFLENTKLALLDWLEPYKSSGKGLRMSIIGRPARQLWYDNRSEAKKEVHDPSTQLKFKTGSLYESDPFGYVAQLSGYEHNEGTTNGGLFAVDKSSGEIALFRPDELMKPNAAELIKSLKEKIKSEEPPEKCYQPIPHDKTGNYKLPVGCVYCSHKFTCHKDTNEGRGLRVFKYANSNVYMTTVENTPRVEEITNNE